MSTIKSYTDLEQSKKLAKILSLESADFFWLIGRLHTDGPRYEVIRTRNEINNPENYLPCWSLAALLNVIPDSVFDSTDEFSQLEFSKKSVAYHDMNDGIKIGSLKDNLVDACYEMILKLHELELL